MKFSVFFLIITFCALEGQFPIIPPTPVPSDLKRHIQSFSEMNQAQATSADALTLGDKHKEQTPLKNPLLEKIHAKIKQLSPHFPIGASTFNFLIQRELNTQESLNDPNMPITFDKKTQWAIAVNSCIPLLEQKSTTEKELKKKIKTVLNPIKKKLLIQIEDLATFSIIKQMHALLQQEKTDEVVQFLKEPVSLSVDEFRPSLTGPWANVDRLKQQEADSCPCVIL